MKSFRLATVWLSGCSGCHMSLLNLHQGLLEMLEQCDLVYSPLMDIKEYPQGVDIVLVEGAVASEDNLEMARNIRERSRFVISMGDCAVNGNVTALRNPLELTKVVRCCYDKAPDIQAVSRLLSKALPLHQVIPVDAFITGCPPAPELIREKLVTVQVALRGFMAPQR